MSFPPAASRSMLRAGGVLRSQVRALNSSSSARQASPAPLPSDEGSSQQSSRSWTPALASGVEAAYDEALKYIYANQAQLRDEVKNLRGRLEGLAKGSEEEASRLKERILSVEIASEVNDPAVRAEFDSGKADLTRPVHLHLHQLWWHRRILPRLLERVKLQYVVPDVIESLTPRVDLRLSFGSGTGYTDHSSDGGEVGTGVWVPARDSLQAPHVTAVPFHSEERLYTAILIDADVPNEESGRLESWCHWLVRDVPLSSGRTTFDPRAGHTAIPYVAPHPCNGGPPRRTALVLIDQTGAQGSASESASVQREAFSIPQYLASRGLNATDVVAAQFWRTKWTEEDAEAISSVWAQRGIAEPRYGREPRRNMFRDPETGRLPSRYFRSLPTDAAALSASE
ncbi:PEBP-like protein [Ceraceosorus guamensis]|uniref:PEBP-like protein n=1 Tax=Ceraceosorus guamensis TaxID=1522189 RepID=A0A316VWD8_9BASI|nr:PEBP-like protein [Ceraceosorus guamensis]PWN41762.1 PEBP-like protein [Ceraceosorus guamensis]